jgi:hypothetical protein
VEIGGKDGCDCDDDRGCEDCSCEDIHCEELPGKGCDDKIGTEMPLS